MKNQSKAKPMLSGPHQRFCQAYAVERNATEAYLAAYPKSSRAAARSSAATLLAKPNVQAEIARIRAAAEQKAGSAVLTLAEKRGDLAAILRTTNAKFRGSEVKTCDRLAAIKLDNDLAGEGSEAEGQDALAQLLERVMK